MDFHVRALSLAYIVYGILSASLALLTLIALGGIREAYAWAGASEGSGPAFIVLLLSHVVLGVPMIIGGFFLRRLEEWARLLMVMVSALNIVNVPVGSVLGAYGLWVLLQPETEPLFSDPVFRAGRPGRRQQKPKASRTTAEPIAPRIKNATSNLPE